MTLNHNFLHSILRLNQIWQTNLLLHVIDREGHVVIASRIRIMNRIILILKPTQVRINLKQWCILLLPCKWLCISFGDHSSQLGRVRWISRPITNSKAIVIVVRWALAMRIVAVQYRFSSLRWVLCWNWLEVVTLYVDTWAIFILTRQNSRCHILSSIFDSISNCLPIFNHFGLLWNFFCSLSLQHLFLSVTAEFAQFDASFLNVEHSYQAYSIL